MNSHNTRSTVKSVQQKKNDQKSLQHVQRVLTPAKYKTNHVFLDGHTEVELHEEESSHSHEVNNNSNSRRNVKAYRTFCSRLHKKTYAWHEARGSLSEWEELHSSSSSTNLKILNNNKDKDKDKDKLAVSAVDAVDAVVDGVMALEISPSNPSNQSNPSMTSMTSMNSMNIIEQEQQPIRFEPDGGRGIGGIIPSTASASGSLIGPGHLKLPHDDDDDDDGTPGMKVTKGIKAHIGPNSSSLQQLSDDTSINSRISHRSNLSLSKSIGIRSGSKGNKGKNGNKNNQLLQNDQYLIVNSGAAGKSKSESKSESKIDV